MKRLIVLFVFTLIGSIGIATLLICSWLQDYRRGRAED